MYEAKGSIKWIGDIQTFPSGFTKREFVVTTSHDKYPQDLKFETVKDKCAMLDDYGVGQAVTVNFDIRGNEYNGKYFVNLSCWKLQAADASAPAPSRGAPAGQAQPAGEPSPEDLRDDDDFDEIPF
jgi:hypothetical protein